MQCASRAPHKHTREGGPPKATPPGWWLAESPCLTAWKPLCKRDAGRSRAELGEGPGAGGWGCHGNGPGTVTSAEARRAWKAEESGSFALLPPCPDAFCGPCRGSVLLPLIALQAKRSIRERQP